MAFLLIAAVALLSFANGANDNFKGVATLWGAGRTSYRRARRKLAGRLEYHRSILDRFKDLHIRPAQRWFSQRSIITTALGSGK